MSRCLSVLAPLQRDFIIQTGDPTGTGRGGESVFWSARGLFYCVCADWTHVHCVMMMMCVFVVNCMAIRHTFLSLRRCRGSSIERKGLCLWWTTAATSTALRLTVLRSSNTHSVCVVSVVYGIWVWLSLFSFGSQFLITTSENLDYLDGVHTVFGEVTEGMDVLSKINETFVDNNFIPYQDIR